MIIENLVFEGGGVKGIAYGGSLLTLEKRGLTSSLKNVAGTSAGSIAATLIAAGYTGQELIDIWNTTELRKFKDNDFGIVRDIYRFLTNYGLYKGDFFYNWIQQLLKDKGFHKNISIKDFNEQSKYKLHILVSDVTNNKSVCISSDNREMNDIPVALATKMSMSIPIYYQAVRYKGCVYCDGGVFNNYPIKVFDTKDKLANTIGFRLGDENKHVQIKNSNNVLQYSANIIACMHGQLQENHLNKNDWNRTIWINCGDISPIDFDLTKNDIDFLVNQGANFTNTYIDSKIASQGDKT